MKLCDQLVLMARAVKPVERKASVAIHMAFGVQILLGIGTVMSGMNIVMAVLHQAVGALVVMLLQRLLRAHGKHV